MCAFKCFMISFSLYGVKQWSEVWILRKRCHVVGCSSSLRFRVRRTKVLCFLQISRLNKRPHYQQSLESPSRNLWNVSAVSHSGLGITSAWKCRISAFKGLPAQTWCLLDFRWAAYLNAELLNSETVFNNTTDCPELQRENRLKPALYQSSGFIGESLWSCWTRAAQTDAIPSTWTSGFINELLHKDLRLISAMEWDGKSPRTACLTWRRKGETALTNLFS